MVILTFCRKVFILISTPLTDPTTIVPFLSSMVTVSFFNFIKNLTNFIPQQIIIRVINIFYQNLIIISMTEPHTPQQLKSIQTEIAHYQQKYEVQQKRIQFLKRQNQDLKDKQQKDQQLSVQIKGQNEQLKKRNRELKNQLNELKLIIKTNHTESGPKTTTIKDLVVNTSTQEIDLPHSQVDDEDLQAIKSFYNIKSLILGENNISNFGFFTICNNLLDLRKLFINHNQINDDGMTTIYKLKNLKCLDIRCNKITSESLKHISKLSLLNQLSISNNQITDNHLQELHNLKELKYLDITSNKISERGAFVIADLSQLNNLYLSHNQITTRSAYRLLEMLQLKVLDVRFNDIVAEDKEQLKKSKGQHLQLFL